MKRLAAMLCLLALSACRPGGDLGQQIQAEIKDVEAALQQVHDIPKGSLDDARARLARHIDVADQKTFDEAHREAFLQDFTDLRFAKRSLDKWQSKSEQQAWLEQLELSHQQLEALAHDWRFWQLSEDEVRLHLDTEQQLIWSVMEQVDKYYGSARWTLNKIDSLDQHFQSLWDNWENTNL